MCVKVRGFANTSRGGGEVGPVQMKEKSISLNVDEILPSVDEI